MAFRPRSRSSGSWRKGEEGPSTQPAYFLAVLPRGAPGRIAVPFLQGFSKGKVRRSQRTSKSALRAANDHQLVEAVPVLPADAQRN